MRRCDRHSYKQHQPYCQFSFEKSLRKYQTTPHKKLKPDSMIILQTKKVLSFAEPQRNNIIQQRKYEEIEIKQTLFRALIDKQNEIVSQKMNEQNQQQQNLVALKENLIVCLDKGIANDNKEDQKNNQIQLKCDHTQILSMCQPKKIDQNNMFHLSQNKNQDNIQKTDQNQDNIVFNSIKIGETIIYQSQKGCGQDIDIQSQPKKEFDIVNKEKNHKESLLSCNKIIKGQQQNFIHEEPIIQKHEQKRQKIKEGRLNLSGNVSISLRTISRYRQKGFTDQQMLQQVLQQRRYLASERGEIAIKLKDYLSLNQ